MSDEFKNTILGVVLTAIIGAVTGLFKKVGANSEKVTGQGKDIEALRAQLVAVEARSISVECVREVIEESLTKRDVQAADRREQWDENLTLRIERAVVAGVRECQELTKAELERMVPRIVHEVLRQTGRTRPEGA